MRPSIGIQSLAVSVPEQVAEPLRRRSPRPPRPSDGSGSSAYRRARAPFAGDPLDGVRERRVLTPGESPLALEIAAARRALHAARLRTGDVDLLISSALLPAAPGIGDAAFLAGELGLRGAAWNLEAEGSSLLVALQSAAALVAAGQHRRVLVVTSCTHSRSSAAEDPTAGDAATAIVVGEVSAGTGLLGSGSVHCTGSGAAAGYELAVEPEGRPRLRRRPMTADAQRVLCQATESHLKECCLGALDRAAVGLDEIDHFITSAPVAWYAGFCARLLGIDRERTLSVYPLYADVGPALLGLNLHHAAHWRPLRPGDRVLLCAVAGLSSVSAAVLRWGDVALGPVPEGVSESRLQALEAETIAGFALDRLEARALEPARSLRDPRRRLERFVGEYVRLIFDEPPVAAVFDPDGAPRGGPLLEERRQAVLGFLRGTIAEVRSGIDPEVATVGLLGILHWGASSYGRGDPRISTADAARQITRLALHGLFTRSPVAPAAVPPPAGVHASTVSAP